MAKETKAPGQFGDVMQKTLDYCHTFSRFGSKEVVTLSRLQQRLADPQTLSHSGAKLLVNASLVANTEKMAASLSQSQAGSKSSSKKSEKASSKSTKRPKTSKM